MELKSFYKKYENLILALAVTVLLGLFAGLRYDYYYDLNDDVVMKDILSGVYTGTPEGHNIQMLYPLSLFISLLYKVLPNAPVYGLILCLCQYGCIWLIVKRSLTFADSTVTKAVLAVSEGILAAFLFMEHLVFVQYTVTCSLLAGAAAFLFVTTPKGLTAAEFMKKNISSVLLVLLAYMMRTEMLALLLPLICVAGVYRWSVEEKIFTGDNFRKYFTIFGSILAGIGITTAIHAVAFGGEGWKQYVEFFNSRTELYDFQGIPSYEGNEELYKELGLAESEQYMLLDQYNFGLDEELDASALDAISAYQAGHKKEEAPFLSRLKENLKWYVYRTIHKEPAGSQKADDYPWNLMVIVGYLAVFSIMVVNSIKKKKVLSNIGIGAGKLIFLFAVRTALWMFILIRGRDPVRITHSLYLMEFCILAAMLHMEAKAALFRTKCPAIFPAIMVLAAVISLPDSVSSIDREYEARAAANVVDGSMKAYCRANEENFYFMDVYSAVSYPLPTYQGTPYSEKMFADVDNRLGNYDIMGGWLVKSPSYDKKLAAFGMDSMEEGILHHENVYMMAELEKGTDYIVSYFREQGTQVSVELADTICDIIGVYRIETVF